MSQWNLEGMWVEATYLDQFKVKGKVEHSRIKYGGGIFHMVVLEKPITIYGAVRERLMLNHKYIARVMDHVS
jgi:hypothetical protein